MSGFAEEFGEALPQSADAQLLQRRDLVDDVQFHSLIAGTTTYNATTTADQNSLMAILAELQSADTFADKVYDIIHGTNSGDPPPHGSDLNGSNKLTWGGGSPTVTASTGTFKLSGDTTAASTADWFFANALSTISDFNDDGVKDEHNNNAIGVF